MKHASLVIMATVAALLAGCGRGGSAADHPPVRTDGPAHPVKG